VGSLSAPPLSQDAAFLDVLMSAAGSRHRNNPLAPWRCLLVTSPAAFADLVQLLLTPNHYLQTLLGGHQYGKFTTKFHQLGLLAMHYFLSHLETKPSKSYWYKLEQHQSQ